MDPIALSTTFATVVGLLTTFKQQHKSKEDANREAFFRWLDDHRHQELKEFILRSQELGTEIDKALQEDHEVILLKLDRIDQVLSSLASRVDGLGGIAHALRPQSDLSEQAISFLRQLAHSSANEFGRITTNEGPILFLTSGGTVEVTESRFVDDDLNTLTELGLLNVRYGPTTGDPFFGITRNAVKLLEAIDE